MWHLRLMLPVWKSLTVDGTGVRQYNDSVNANISSKTRLVVVLAAILVALTGLNGALAQTSTSAQEGQQTPQGLATAMDVVAMMLDSQANLRGYKADAAVEVVTPRLRVPKVSVKVVVKRPADVTVEYLWTHVKPRYPLFPDPAMFTEGAYSLQMNGLTDDRYYWVSARPLKGAASPYNIDLWVEQSSGLLRKARLSLPTGESTTLTADYTKMGPKCWVPEKVSGSGAMLLRDIMPLAPVELALRLVGNPDAVQFSAVFTDISLIH